MTATTSLLGMPRTLNPWMRTKCEGEHPPSRGRLGGRGVCLEPGAKRSKWRKWRKMGKRGQLVVPICMITTIGYNERASELIRKRIGRRVRRRMTDDGSGRG
jgi:hypothetical protein